MEVFADLHIHIGRASNGKPIKITASRTLTFENIVEHSVNKKGMHFIGIIDCASPYVINDIKNFLKKEEAYELESGGIIYKDKICVILGAEIETSEINENGKTGSAHNLCYFPHLKDIEGFSNEMQKYIKNMTLSTQRAKISGYNLIDIVKKYNGILIPAHVFTPFKSYYGNCTKSLKRIFKEKYSEISAIELGLSADTEIADKISELEAKSFLTNSDAHSLEKIAREYNKLEVEDISFNSLFNSIKNTMNNPNIKNIIKANYGMDPKLGKYHKTFCDNCNQISDIENGICKICGSKKITYGVFNRVEDIKDKEKSKSPKLRQKYIYQIPLEFVPGLGKKTILKLYEKFGTEMDILHKINYDTIEAEMGKKIADILNDLKNGKYVLQEGGAGHYGKVKKEK